MLKVVQLFFLYIKDCLLLEDGLAFGVEMIRRVLDLLRHGFEVNLLLVEDADPLLESNFV